MGYGNRPKMPNNNHSSNNRKPYSSNNLAGKKNTQNAYSKNNFVFKSDDDIYTPKVYAKKVKEKSMFDEVIIPEYIEDKQRIRNKRENDKKYKNKDRGRY